MCHVSSEAELLTKALKVSHSRYELSSSRKRKLSTSRGATPARDLHDVPIPLSDTKCWWRLSRFDSSALCEGACMLAPLWYRRARVILV